jgi:hypothetical protein
MDDKELVQVLLDRVEFIRTHLESLNGTITDHSVLDEIDAHLMFVEELIDPSINRIEMIKG